MKVFIVGAGTMGAEIAFNFAIHKNEVWLYDTVQVATESGIKKIQNSLNERVALKKMHQKEAEEAMARVKQAQSLEGAVDADLVVEAIFENISIKRNVFEELDAICSENTLFASNTMALSITDMADGLSHVNKFCGMHFFKIPTDTKLVEVVPGLLTDEETVDEICKIAYSIGKEPVVVQETPGFLVNRLVLPVINDAIFLLQEHVASAEDIDRAMVLMGHVVKGPLHLADELGLDNVLQVLDHLLEETGDPKFRPCPLLRKMVRASLLGRKTGRGFFEY